MDTADCDIDGEGVVFMGYRLTFDESLPDGIRRIADEEIDAVINHLAEPQMEIEKSIHETRKCFKKIRALLGLVRGELGALYVTENAWFRDAGRSLSGYRDISAMLEALSKLRDSVPAERVDDAVFDVAASVLEQKRVEVICGSEDLYVHTRALATKLEKERARIETWSLSRDDFGAVRYGLGRTYKRGRRALRNAYTEKSPQAFHEWRKRVKYHWYHCRLLLNVWPELMDVYTEQVHRLAELLGDYHDLDVLRRHIVYEIGPNADQNMNNLCDLIAERQSRLRQDAFPIGYRLYAEKKKKFVDRIKHYWDAASLPGKLDQDAF